MKVLISIITLVFYLLGIAQIYEPDPCEGSGNAELKKILSGSSLDNFYLYGCGPGWTDAVASSFLKSSGIPPDKPEENQFDDEIIEVLEDYYMDYDLWSCKYAPSNLSDGDSATAWVEGASGHGIGEVVLVAEVNVFKPIEIWNGYGKTESLYKYNGRIKRARVHILRGKQDGATQCGTVFKEIIKVASKEVSLIDRNGFQPLDIPTFSKGTYEFQGQQWEYNYWLMIEILEVYPGTKWPDTCISEVRNS